MKRCKLLLPPLQLSDRRLEEEGAIADLPDNDAQILSGLGVVEILSEECPIAPPVEEFVEAHPETEVESDRPTAKKKSRS